MKKSLLISADQTLVCLIADSNYTHLVFDTGKSELSTKNLARYDNVLSDSFLRVNRSCTVNIGFIKQVNRFERSILLKNDIQIMISRRRWLHIKENLLSNKI